MANEVFECELDPDTKTVLRIYLFTNVVNVNVIRNNIVSGVWNCAVIKASLIVDPLQVAVAANKAVVAERQHSMVTKTVYADILYNLSLTKNISQSLIKFGVDKDNSLLFCFLITGNRDDTESIVAKIEGEQRPMCDLGQFSNIKDIKNVYKLNNFKCSEEVNLLDVILSKMVTKNFITH